MIARIDASSSRGHRASADRPDRAVERRWSRGGRALGGRDARLDREVHVLERRRLGGGAVHGDAPLDEQPRPACGTTSRSATRTSGARRPWAPTIEHAAARPQTASAVAASIGPPRSSSASTPCQRSAASSSGRPKARSRPRCSTAMRSASRPASPRKWVAQHDGAAVLGGQRADEVDDVAGGGRVEARGRLVEEQHLGVVEQRPGQGEALALAGREALHEDVGPVGHAEPLEQLVARRSGRRAVERPACGPVSTRFSRAVRRSSRPAFSVRTPVRRRTSSPSIGRVEAEHAGAAPVGAQDRR